MLKFGLKLALSEELCAAFFQQRRGLISTAFEMYLLYDVLTKFIRAPSPANTCARARL